MNHSRYEEEPRYIDDPFESEDQWWLAEDAPKYDLLSRALQACYRSVRWKAKSETVRWDRICRYPDEWIVNCIEWAEKKNEQRLIIKFTALQSAMLNHARYEEWEHANSSVISERTSKVTRDTNAV